MDDDPKWMLQQHLAQGNVLTVFCVKDPGAARPRRAALLRSAGVYYCEPVVLDFIRSEGYQDLKEQLIPALQRSGHRVGAVTLKQATCEVSDWPTYLSVLTYTLSKGRFDNSGYRELAPGVWGGEGVTIEPRARIVGPVLLDHGCTVEDDAVVLGPAIVGKECHLESGSWVIRAVLRDRMQCRKGTSIVDQFVPDPRRLGITSRR